MIDRTNVMSGAGGTNVMYGAGRTKFQMVSVQRSIWVKFEVIGFHCYPDAPEQVAYLRERHRHKFGFTVSMPVTHNEREVEFVSKTRNFIPKLYLLLRRLLWENGLPPRPSVSLN